MIYYTISLSPQLCSTMSPLLISTKKEQPSSRRQLLTESNVVKILNLTKKIIYYLIFFTLNYLFDNDTISKSI